MSLKGFIIKSLVSIPHLSILIDRRIHHRYEPREDLNIELNGQDAKLYGQLLDISLGGMRIISTDERIEELDSIILTVDDFRIEVPCKEIRKVGPYYGIVFGELDKTVAENLNYFLNHFMIKPPVYLTSVGR
jgi:hypothetical protein